MKSLVLGACLFLTVGNFKKKNEIPADRIAYTAKGQPTMMNQWLTIPGQPEEYITFIKDLIPQGQLLFDVGANLGNKTAIYLEAGASRVVCFEPEERSYKELQARFANDSRVVMEQLGLAPFEGTLEFMVCSQSGLSTFSKDQVNNSRFTDEADWSTKIHVPVTTLDSMIRKYGLPWYCKIDVEAFELEVLHGLSQPIPLISFECNIEHWEKTKKCMQYLQDLGYTKFNFAFSERGLFLFEGWQMMEQLIEGIEEIKTVYYPTGKCLFWGDVYASY